MTREFIMTTVFDKLWNKLGLSDDDLLRLQIEMMTNPKVGAIIRGTEGARKTRFAQSGAGKSGGVRVIYADLESNEQIFLILCYPKSQQDDLTSEQRDIVKGLIKTLKGAH